MKYVHRPFKRTKFIPKKSKQNNIFAKKAQRHNNDRHPELCRTKRTWWNCHNKLFARLFQNSQLLHYWFLFDWDAIRWPLETDNVLDRVILGSGRFVSMDVALDQTKAGDKCFFHRCWRLIDESNEWSYLVTHNLPSNRGANFGRILGSVLFCRRFFTDEVYETNPDVYNRGRWQKKEQINPK